MSVDGAWALIGVALLVAIANVLLTGPLWTSSRLAPAEKLGADAAALARPWELFHRRPARAGVVGR